MNALSKRITKNAALALLLAAGSVRAQCPDPGALVPADPQTNCYFGGTLSLRGQYMLAGANSRLVQGATDAGKVYAFKQVNGAWGETGSIIPLDPTPHAWFGMGIGMDSTNSWAVIGAAGFNSGNGKGYFFQRDTITGIWSQVGQFAPGLGVDARFGMYAAMNKAGTIAVMSAPYANVTDLFGTTTEAGLALVYHRGANNVWTYEMDLHQYDASIRHPNDFYGMGLAADDDTIVTGAPYGDGPGKTNCGYIHIWNRDAFGSWTANGEVYAPDATAGDMFGVAVSMGGGTLAVGAEMATIGGQVNAGAVYLYKNVNGSWVFDGKVSPSNPTQAWFGSVVSVSGDWLVAGSESGIARYYLFRRIAPGQWVQDAVYTPPSTATPWCGSSLAIDGSQFAAGDWDYKNGNMISAGAAYMYNVPTSGSDSCEGATALNQGSFWGCTALATVDGSTGCGSALPQGPDMWYSHTPSVSGPLTIDTQGSMFDTILSIHSGCPGDSGNSIVCNDDYASPQRWSKVTFQATAGVKYLIRVSGYGGQKGAFQLNIGAGAACYANCDGSTSTPLLTANDFQCFLNKYAANDPYANCDGSTASPLLTANDFQCFLNKFATGCS